MSPEGRGVKILAYVAFKNETKHKIMRASNSDWKKYSVFNLFITTPYRKGCIKILACLPLKRCSAMRTVKLGHKNWTRMSWTSSFIALFCYSCLWLVTRDDVLWLHRNWAILLSARNSSLATWSTGKSNIFLFHSICHVLAKNKFDGICRNHEKNYI